MQILLSQGKANKGKLGEIFSRKLSFGFGYTK